jgi:hypothetical protein
LPIICAVARAGQLNGRQVLVFLKRNRPWRIGASKKADALPLGDPHRKADDLLL